MLRVRDATSRDVPLILSLVRELAEFEREPNAVSATAKDLQRDGFSRKDPKFRAIIAELDNKPAGMALFFEHYSTWQGRHGIFVEDLIVRSGFRGKGVGQALMARLAKVAMKDGCYGMRWEVHSWNKPAIAFYQQLGGTFRQNGRVMQLKRKELERLAETKS